MVDQEDIFKNQAHELHQLYKMQKIFMKEDHTVGSRGIPHSFFSSFPENFEYESLTTVTRPNEDTICSSESVQNHCRIEHRDIFKHQQLSLDLELASSHYTEASAIMNHGIYDDYHSSSKMLKLSREADHTHQSSGRKACNDKIICSPSLRAIHLERSTYGALAAQSGAKNEFMTSCSIRRRKSDTFNWISESHLLSVGMENFREREKLLQGVSFSKSFSQEQWHVDVSCENMPITKKSFASHEVAELDLNKALPDETSISPIDQQAFDSTQSAYSGVSRNEITDHGQAAEFTVLDFTKTSELAQQEFTTSTVTTSPSKDTNKHICRSELCSVDSSSLRRCPSGTMSAVDDYRNVRPGECGISLKEKTSQRISMAKADVEKKVNKLPSYNSNQELLAGAGSSRSPVSCNSDCNADDVSCNLGIPNSNVPSRRLTNPKSSQVSEGQVEPMTKSQYFGSEGDKTVRKGAVSLIYFSCSARNHDCSPKSKKIKKICCAEREMPQSSSESYESIVLKQVDCSVDEYCVSSTPMEAVGLDKKNNGVKLKRGRRMKDFRKEILPGLASLSKEEICEDIRIMEIALRSREYKKYSSKIAGRRDCISSVRSRRPGLRRGGRSYCS